MRTTSRISTTLAWQNRQSKCPVPTHCIRHCGQPSLLCAVCRHFCSHTNHTAVMPMTRLLAVVLLLQLTVMMRQTKGQGKLIDRACSMHSINAIIKSVRLDGRWNNLPRSCAVNRLRSNFAEFVWFGKISDRYTVYVYDLFSQLQQGRCHVRVEGRVYKFDYSSLRWWCVVMTRTLQNYYLHTYIKRDTGRNTIRSTCVQNSHTWYNDDHVSCY